MLRRPKAGASRTPDHSEAGVVLSGGQNADQALADVVPGDFVGQGFLALAAVQVVQRPTAALGQGLGMGLEASLLFFCEGTKVLDQNV
jgi:hypothetical protein